MFAGIPAGAVTPGGTGMAGSLVAQLHSQLDLADGGEIFVELLAIAGADAREQGAGILGDVIEHALPRRVLPHLLDAPAAAEQTVEHEPGIDLLG